MDSGHDTPYGVGCPIRTSRDRRSLAPSPGLSQRATSFIASRRQGIHQMPFVHSPTTPPRPSRKAGSGSHTHAGRPGCRHPERPRSPKARHHTMSDHRSPARTPTRPAAPDRPPPTLPPQAIARGRRTAPRRRHSRGRRREQLVGPGRFERPTSPLSGVRSNRLSYGPGSPEGRRTDHKTPEQNREARASPPRLAGSCPLSAALRPEGICRRRPATGRPAVDGRSRRTDRHPGQHLAPTALRP